MAEDEERACRVAEFRRYLATRAKPARVTANTRGLKVRDFSAADLPELRQLRIDLVEAAALMPHRAVKIRVIFAALDGAITTIEAGTTTETRMAELRAATRLGRAA